MNCPVCFTLLRQNLLLLGLSIISCPNQGCVYPFNLLLAELQEKKLLVKVSERDIMKGMQEKLASAEIDTKLADFIARDDSEVYSP